LLASGTPRPSLTKSGTFGVVRSSAPFAGNTAALAFFPRIDTVVVATASVVAASYFALGFQITTTALLVPAIASATLYPFLVGRDDLRRARLTVIFIMIVVGLIASGIGYATAPRIVPLLFGSKYRVAVGAIRVMLLSVPFAFISYTLLGLMYAAGRERAVVRVVWVPAIIGTGLVIVGAHTGGATGAAWGYTARYALQALALGVLAYRSFVVSVSAGSDLYSSG
jgi:O-antigen/teichoic acid export membrane protein